MAATGPAVGTVVTVNVQIHLGTATGDPESGYPAAPADNFTGRYDITQEMVLDHYTDYSWSISPVLGFDTYLRPNAFSGGFIDFVGGKLSGFSLFYVADPDEYRLSHRGWGYDFDPQYSPAGWGGTWTIDAAEPVPEPAAWSLMIAGFGMVGAAVRRRRGTGDLVRATR